MKEEQKENQKKNTGGRKLKFENALKKCPKISISDKKVIELKNEGKK